MREQLLDLLRTENVSGARELLERVPPEDVARMLQDLPEVERALLLQALEQPVPPAQEAESVEPPQAEADGDVATAAERSVLAPEAVTQLLADRQFDALHTLLTETDAVDVARVIDTLPRDEAVVAFRLLPKDFAVEVFEALDPDRQQALIQGFTEERARELISGMPPDERARLIDELPAIVAHRLLQLLPPADRTDTLMLLGYPENSAGRAMTPDFVYLRHDMTVGRALERIRQLALDKETIYYSYIIDSSRHLQGTVSLRELIVAPSDTTLGEIMKPEPVFVRTLDDQEKVAQVLKDYHLLALPVVDAEDRLVGIVTYDDVLEILEAEATEDINLMAGLGVKERVTTPWKESAARRIPWLAFNMVWAFAGAVIISVFQGTIEQVAAIAVFMPLIAGQAGNSGIQTATIVVRSMALGDLERISIRQLLLKEWGVGILKGVLFGGILFLAAWSMKQNVWLAAIAGAALFLNMLVASTAGVSIPLLLRRLGVDPATVAGVFDTMLTDFMGFIIYLGLSTLFLALILRAV